MSRRPAAILAILAGAVAIGAGAFVFVDEFPLGLVGFACVFGALGAAWMALLRRGAARVSGSVIALVLIAGAGVIVQNVQGTLQVPLMARLRLGWVSLLEIGRQLVGSAMILALIAKIGIGAALSVLVFFAYWFIFYSDIASKIEGAQRQKTTLHDELATQQHARVGNPYPADGR